VVCSGTARNDRYSPDLSPITIIFPYHHVQKWAKTRAREKKNHAVGINKSLHDSVLASAAKKTKYVTLYTLIANYAVGGAVARKLVKELAAAGTIRKVVGSGSLAVYAPKA